MARSGMAVLPAWDPLLAMHRHGHAAIVATRTRDTRSAPSAQHHHESDHHLGRHSVSDEFSDGKRLSEQSKDVVEDAGGLLLELAMSPLPFLGTLTSRMLGSAAGRRNAAVLEQLQADLTRLSAKVHGRFEELAADDAFIAATNSTARKLLEAGTEDKRRLLRHALMSRGANADSPDAADFDDFDDALDRLMPRDLVLLLELSQHSHVYGLSYGDSDTNDRLAPELGPLSPRINRLVTLGLAEETTDVAQRYRDAFDGVTHNPNQSLHVISDFGQRFLTHLEDPFED